MKALTPDALMEFLRALERDFEVRVPIRLRDGTRALGRLDEGPLALQGGRLPRKPTELFFPQQQKVFDAYGDGRYALPPNPDKPLFVLGFTAADLDCLEFVDRFFSTGFADDLYLQRRRGAVIVGLTGRCAPGEAIEPLAGRHCDLELVLDGERLLLLAHTPSGERLTADLPGEVPDSELEPLRQAGAPVADADRPLLARAAALIREGQVPDAVWAAIGDRCIACTACNLVCPTCNCFGVQDWRYPTHVERSRMWDSCQLDGFMREASGHNPLGSEGLRTRRRIHHKLVADVTRWGHFTCFLCRRCDSACPTGIGILAVCRELLEGCGEDVGQKTKME